MLLLEYMYRKNKKSQSKVRNTFVWYASAIVIVAGALSFTAWHLSGNKADSNSKSSSATTKKKSKIDLSPATPSDQADSDSHKSDIVTQQNTPPATATATPVIDFAGYNNPGTNTQLEVDSHVDGVVESGGTCTLTATLGSRTVTKTVTGVRNAQNTSCPAFILTNSDFGASGTWNIQISYSSSAYSGTSKAQTLKVDD